MAINNKMLSIRKATKQDAKAAWEIRNTAILDQCIGCYPADSLETWTGGELTEGFANNVDKHFYVATNGDDVVGTGMINIEAGKIVAIFVRPRYMRKGIGRMILSFLESIALKHGLDTLTLESTLIAASFYRACGFKGNDVSTYHSPRGITLDCIPMIKTISTDNHFKSTTTASLR